MSKTQPYLYRLKAAGGLVHFVANDGAVLPDLSERFPQGGMAFTRARTAIETLDELDELAGGKLPNIDRDQIEAIRRELGM